jgi:hypothetical protein
MISCHVCHASVYYGTLFCPECCARVSEDTSSPTNALPASKAADFIPPKPTESSHAPLTSEDRIALMVAGNNVGIPLFGQQEYEKGVSRLHCHLRFEGNSLLAIDLGSANGTFINDNRVLPDHPAMLSDGDILRLGNLIIEVTRQIGGQ